MKQYETETKIISNDQALEVCERERHDFAISLDKLGTAHYFSNDYKVASIVHEQALTIYNELYGEGYIHSDVAIALNNLGAVHNALGNYQESIEYHYQALEIYMELGGWGYFDFETIVDEFGIEYFGNYEKAREYHSKKFDDEMRRFCNATTHPELDNDYELYNPDFDFYQEYYREPPYVYRNLRDAIAFYREALYIRDHLDRFYEDQRSEYVFAYRREEESIADFIEYNPDME